MTRAKDICLGAKEVCATQYKGSWATPEQMSEIKQRQSRTHYACARCGATFHQLTHYKAHAARKRTCPATVEDVTPSMDNVRVTRTLDGREPVVVNINLSHSNNNTIHNNTNVTNNFNIMAFGSEDKSHLTPELLERLIARHPAGTAVLHMVQLVHFNPSKPENMNVCANVDEPSKARVFDGRGWRDLNKEDTALNMAKEVADDLVSHIDGNPASVTPYKTEHYHEFAEGLDYDLGTIERTVDAIDEYSYMVQATHGNSGGRRERN